MEVDERAGAWTLADVFQLPDSVNRYEVIDGKLIVSPPPSARHQFVGSELLFQLRAAAPAEWRVVYESYLDYGGDGRVPDLLVVRSSALGDRLAYPPSAVGLAVEIVSPSSRRTDRLAKPAEFAEQGLPLFWRVELEPELVVHPFRLAAGTWQAEPEIRHTGPAPVPWGTLLLDLTGLASP
jgi:Uma2 family endonuclease